MVRPTVYQSKGPSPAVAAAAARRPDIDRRDASKTRPVIQQPHAAREAVRSPVAATAKDQSRGGRRPSASPRNLCESPRNQARHSDSPQIGSATGTMAPTKNESRISRHPAGGGARGSKSLSPGREGREEVNGKRVTDSGKNERDGPVISKVTSESILEKRKRMVQYKERLEKKSAHELQQSSGSEEKTPAKIVPSSGHDARPNRQTTTNAFGEQIATVTDGKAPKSNGGNKRRSKSSEKRHDGTGLNSLSQSKRKSPEKAKAGLTNPELTNQRLSRDSERATSHKSTGEKRLHRGRGGWSRQSSNDDVAASIVDPLMVYSPKSPRSQMRARQRNLEKIKQEPRSPGVVRSSIRDDGARKSQAEEPARESRSPLNALRIVSKKAPKSGQLKSPARELGAATKAKEKNKYTSFDPIVDDKSILKEAMPPTSAQNHAFDATCGGSSLFSALTDGDETDSQFPSSIGSDTSPSGALVGRSTTDQQNLVLSGSSSLFSFQSDNSCNELNQVAEAKVASPSFRAESSQAQDKMASDSKAPGDSIAATPADLLADAALAASNKRGSIFSYVSNALVRKAPEESGSLHLSPDEGDQAKISEKQQDIEPSDGGSDGGNVTAPPKRFFPSIFRLPKTSRNNTRSKTGLQCSEQAKGDDESTAKAHDQDINAEEGNSKVVNFLDDGHYVGGCSDIQLLSSPANMMKSMTTSMGAGSACFFLQPTKCLKFPHPSAGNEEPKIFDGPLNNVRLTLGYLQGVRRVAKSQRTYIRGTANESLVVGFAYIDETPSVAFMSSQRAESLPVTTTLGDPTSSCNIIWSGKGHRDKMNGRLYLSVVMDSKAHDSPHFIRLVVGLKQGQEMIRLGTASFSLDGEAVDEKVLTASVVPDKEDPDLTKRRGGQYSQNFFSGNEKVRYELDSDAKLRIRLDVKEGHLGAPGPSIWGDREEEDQSFVHSLYELESVNKNVEDSSHQQRGLTFCGAREDQASLEVVSLANGSTYISTSSIGSSVPKDRSQSELSEGKAQTQRCRDYNFDPLLDDWNCAAPILEDESFDTDDVEDDTHDLHAEEDTHEVDIKHETDTKEETHHTKDIPLVLQSNKSLTQVVAPSSSQGGLELILIPAKEKKKKPWTGLLKRRRTSRLKVDADAVMEEISSPSFRVQVRSPLGLPSPRKNMQCQDQGLEKQAVEVESTKSHNTAGNDKNTAPPSHDDSSQGITTHVTSNSHSQASRKSQPSHKSAVVDRAADWLVQNFKGILGNASSDSDDLDRRTTFSHSTTLGAESTHDVSEITGPEMADYSSSKHRSRHPQRYLSIQKGIHAVVSALSDAASSDSESNSSVGKSFCKDMKRVLAIAEQLNMKPGKLIKRIEAGETIEEIMHKRRLKHAMNNFL